MFSRHVTSASLLLLSVVFTNSALAAEDELYFAEMPMVASVSRLPQKISEAPAAVTVIDRDMIRASGFRTVEDLLRLVPGFLVASHNQDAALVAYHGLTGGMTAEEYSPRVQVLIDGRSQYSPLFKSGVNWNLLPVALENIERIEVVRGSNTVTYGSNAALGVINIVTQDTSQTKGWLLAANRGNNGIRDETIRWGGKAGEADVRFTARELSDQGFRLGDFKNYATGQDIFWWDMPDSRRSRVFDLKGDLALSNRDELQFSLSQATDVSQFGRPNFDPNFASSMKYPLWFLHTSSTSLGLQWKHLVSADEELKLRYNYTQDESSGSYSERTSFTSVFVGGGSAIGFNQVDAAGMSKVHELEFEHIKPLNEQTRLVWGLSGKAIALYSLMQFSSSDWMHRSIYRSFGNVEYRPSRDWLFNVGASLERDSLSGVQFDPRLSASYHLNPENTLRAVASRAHRTPSLYEYMGKVQKFGVDNNGQTNKNLEYFGQGVAPERIDTLEVGYFGEWKSLRASLDVRRFREHIPNRIQVVPLALPASSPDDHENTGNRYGLHNNVIYPNGRADGAVNMEDVMIAGSEYQFRWQPFDSTRLIYSQAVLTITAAPDYSMVADDLANNTTINNTTKISRQTRESAPASAQSAMLIQQLPYNLQASVMYFQTGAMRWRRNSDAPNLENERFDWRLAKTFKVGTSRVEVAYTEQMVNGSQEGRVNATRVIDKLQWLTLRVDF